MRFNILSAMMMLSGVAGSSEKRPVPASSDEWSTATIFEYKLSQFYPRGSELQDLLTQVVQVVSDLVEPLQDKPITLYEAQVYPDVRDRMRECVAELARLCAAVTRIVSEDTAEGSENRIRWFGSANMNRFMTFSCFHALSKIEVNITSEFISTTRQMEIPTLIIQASNMIDQYLFMYPSPTRNKGGWNLDIQRFGVDVSDALPDFIIAPPMPLLPRIEMVQALESRLEAFENGTEFDYDTIAGCSDGTLRAWLHEEVDKIVVGIQPQSWEDIMVEHALKIILYPRIHTLFRYLWSVPEIFLRSRAKLVTDLFEFAKPALSISMRLSLAHEFSFAHSADDIESPIADVTGVPHVSLELGDFDPERLVAVSASMINTFLIQFPFAYRGLSVHYVETNSRGDGVRRDWLRQIVDRLFVIHDGSPDGDNFVACWEFSDHTRTRIRPRQMASMKTEAQKNQLEAGLFFSGTILGIAITYDIVPGVALSPVSLALLQQPGSDFSALAREEDPQLCDNLDKLKDLDLSDPDTVAAVLTDEYVEFGGMKVPVTPDNLETYIEQKKFRSLFESIHREMAIVAQGIHGFVRRGSLDLMSREELSGMLAGPGELSASRVVEAIDFSDSPDQFRKWLTEILTEMTKSELSQFMIFVTASAHLPVKPHGFWMKLNVSDQALSLLLPESTYPLPTSATCFRTLNAPQYPSRESFRRKLIQAITEGRSLVNE